MRIKFWVGYRKNLFTPTTFVCLSYQLKLKMYSNRHVHTTSSIFIIKFTPVQFNLMDVLTLVAGILSLIFVIILQEYGTNFMTIDDNDTMSTKGMLLSSTRTINCTKLRSELFNFCKAKDVYRVRAIYRLYLDQCLKDKGDLFKSKMKEYFENYLDSFLNDEEREVEDLTRRNTERNKEYIKSDYITEVDISIENDKHKRYNYCYGPPPSSPSSLSSPEGKIRKQVQINLEPEVKLIAKRRRRNKRRNDADIIIDDLD